MATASRSPGARGAKKAMRLLTAAALLLALQLVRSAEDVPAAQEEGLEITDEVPSLGRRLAQAGNNVVETVPVKSGVQPVPPYVPFTAPPNCAQAPYIFSRNTNVYRAFKDKMANVRDYNDDRSPKETNDDLHWFLIDVCNYIASKSIQQDGATICCRAVDLYGDMWATQTVWGTVAQGNNFQTLNVNRGVNFTKKEDVKREGVLISQSPTVYTAAQTLVCSNTDLNQNLTCSFKQQNKKGSDASRSTTMTAGVEMSYVMKFGSKGLFGGTEFTFQLDFGWSWSESRSETISKAEGTGSELPLRAPPGECYGITATTASTTGTYQLRQKALLQGPVYMYFTPYTANAQTASNYRYWGWVVEGRNQNGTTPPGGTNQMSALKLLNDPKFKLPEPKGGGTFINTPKNKPNEVSVGNYNAPDVKNKMFGPYLDSWGPNDNIASWLQNRRDILSGDDYFILRSDAVYIATPADFVKYAISIGYPIDEYHKSLVDNVWTKVDTVSVTYNTYDAPIEPLDINSEVCKGYEIPTIVG